MAVLTVAEVACRSRTTATCKRTRSRCSTRSTRCSSCCSGDDRLRRHPASSTSHAHGMPRHRRASRSPPTSPSGSCVRACPSARRTRWPAAACAGQRQRGVELWDLSDDEISATSATTSPRQCAVCCRSRGALDSRSAYGGHRAPVAGRGTSWSGWLRRPPTTDGGRATQLDVCTDGHPHPAPAAHTLSSSARRPASCPRSFFTRARADVVAPRAPRLPSSRPRRAEGLVSVRLTEVEAYAGERRTRASHAWRGPIAAHRGHVRSARAASTSTSPTACTGAPTS
jgi:hypothetical protein